MEDQASSCAEVNSRVFWIQISHERGGGLTDADGTKTDVHTDILYKQAILGLPVLAAVLFVITQDAHHVRNRDPALIHALIPDQYTFNEIAVMSLKKIFL